MAILLPNDEVPREKLNGYRIFIFSHDHPHPPHVHFGKGKRFSGWDITTATCLYAGGFSSSEIRLQRKMLIEFQAAILRSWDAHWQQQKASGSQD